MKIGVVFLLRTYFADKGDNFNLTTAWRRNDSTDKNETRLWKQYNWNLQGLPELEKYLPPSSFTCTSNSLRVIKTIIY